MIAGVLHRRAGSSSAADAAVEAAIRRLVRDALGGAAAEEAGAAPRAAVPPGPHPSEYVLASYLEGQLHGPAEEAFEKHAALCAACAEELVLASRSGVGARRRGTAQPWKIAAGLALVLGGLVAALLAAGMVRGRLEQATLAAVRGTLGDRARVEGASLTLAGGPGVEITGLAVHGPAADAPLLSAPSARFDIDLASLGEGRLSGKLHLHGPIINVVREPAGGLNIDAILPRSTGDARDVFAKARRRAIRAVEISSGTLRLIDRSGGERREIRMAALDASLTGLDFASAAHVAARAGLESTRQNLRVAGDIGPWGEGVKPAYRFSDVALDQVSIRNLPGIGSVMRGGLSFAGRLASSGDTWAEISSGFAGAGDLQVVSGSIAGHNVIADVLSPLLRTAEGGQNPSGTIQTLLAADDTSFGDLASPVTVAGSRIEATDFALHGNGFAVAGRGALATDGGIEFRGELAVSPEVTRELLAFAPGAAALVGDTGGIAIPFGVSGSWPAVRVTVDVEEVASRTILRRGFAQLLFAPRG